jgi:hypothetical protein
MAAEKGDLGGMVGNYLMDVHWIDPASGYRRIMIFSLSNDKQGYSEVHVHIEKPNQYGEVQYMVTKKFSHDPFAEGMDVELSVWRQARDRAVQKEKDENAARK